MSSEKEFEGKERRKVILESEGRKIDYIVELLNSKREFNVRI